MNAKKSLETHCEGMKHLKRKALWEKNQCAGGGDMGRGSDASANSGPKKRAANRDSRDTSPPNKRRTNANYEPLGPRVGSGRPGGPRAGFGFEGRGGRRGGGRGPREDGWVSGGREEPWLANRDYGNGPSVDYGHGSGNMQGPGPNNMQGHGSNSMQGYGPNNMQQNHPGPMRNEPPMQPQPQMDPNITPIVLPKMEKLQGGTTGMLLKKLASCYMKDEDDADLAIAVVGAHASSLREFYTKNKKDKIAELLMEAELKFNTMKALKVGLKMAETPKAAAVEPARYGNNAAVAGFGQQQQQQGYGGAQQ